MTDLTKDLIEHWQTTIVDPRTRLIFAWMRENPPKARSGESLEQHHMLFDHGFGAGFSKALEQLEKVASMKPVKRRASSVAESTTDETISED